MTLFIFIFLQHFCVLKIYVQNSIQLIAKAKIIKYKEINLLMRIIKQNGTVIVF